MLKKELLAVLAVVTLLAGCASSETRDTAAVEPTSTEATETVAQTEPAAEKKMRCKRIKPIGSKRTQLVCSDPNQSDEEARRTQDAVSRNQSRGGACIGCGGDG